MDSLKEILNSIEFQKEAPRKLKHIVRKVNREAARRGKDLREVQKDARKQTAA